ncbi:MAG: hypothetical protein MZV64_10105 [Ignavibacteriales bacterium]|nr:hypothetical protein [Ignavibacteriales bacterium]
MRQVASRNRSRSGGHGIHDLRLSRMQEAGQIRESPGVLQVPGNRDPCLNGRAARTLSAAPCTLGSSAALLQNGHRAHIPRWIQYHDRLRGRRHSAAAHPV